MKTRRRAANPRGKRVAIIDGYAGEGRYDDGQEGLPALLIAKAKKIAPQRHLEIHLVEEDPKIYAKLARVVAAEGKGVKVETHHGDVAEHLDALLAKVAGIPTFVFLDPCGLMIPFDSVTRILTPDPPPESGWFERVITHECPSELKRWDLSKVSLNSGSAMRS